MKKIVLFTCFEILMFTIMAQYPYSLEPLPYPYHSLEPSIDSVTMRIHHTKHHLGYVTNLNKTLESVHDSIGYIKQWPLDSLLRVSRLLSAGLRNNGGGHWNHSFFWHTITPVKRPLTDTALLAAIKSQYGSIDTLMSRIELNGKSLFGSGWVWLIVEPSGKLTICTTANQDNPLMPFYPSCQGHPILGIDVWEHAYYLKYQSLRSEYLKAVLNQINWEKVAQRFHQKK